MNHVIENNFSQHPLSSEQGLNVEHITTTAKELAYVIDEKCLASREKSLAMTKLEECLMWANAAIARN